MLARGSEGMVLFQRLAASAKRFALSRHGKHENTKIQQLTERADRTIRHTRLQNEMRFCSVSSD